MLIGDKGIIRRDYPWPRTSSLGHVSTPLYVPTAAGAQTPQEHPDLTSTEASIGVAGGPGTPRSPTVWELCLRIITRAPPREEPPCPGSPPAAHHGLQASPTLWSRQQLHQGCVFPDGETGSEGPYDLPSSPSQQVKGQRVELVYDLILSVFPLAKRHGSATWNLLFIYFWGECGFFQAQMHYIMSREHHLKYVNSRRGDWR